MPVRIPFEGVAYGKYFILAASGAVRSRLPFELAPDEALARELSAALRNLTLDDTFERAIGIVERMKQIVMPSDRRVHNRATGEDITELPRDSRSRRQRPTHSGL